MNQPPTKPSGSRFKLGRIFATPAALHACERSTVTIFDLLLRHLRGDWGDLPESDRQQNERALEVGLALLSSYKLSDGQVVWIITEWDRSVTTLLLPSDY
ncbi:hypothetical protein [Burkholderia sp. 3C]